MKEAVYVDKKGKRRPGVERTCPVCATSFITRKYYNERDHRPDICCSQGCALNLRWGKNRRVKSSCSYCGKEIHRRVKEVRKSKSGMLFCCREHKDLAQRLGSGVEGFRPAHYGTAGGLRGYRTKALRHYQSKCEGCGYCELEQMLDVHHMDGDRGNDDIENLMVLCAWCHTLVTRGLVKVASDRSLVKCYGSSGSRAPR